MRAPPIVGFNRELMFAWMMRVKAVLLTLLFTTSMFAGCLGSNDEGSPVADDLDVGVQTLIGGIFQNVKFSASNDLSVYIPYLIMNPDSGYVQNSTIIDIKKGSSIEVSILAPPRAEIALFMIGELGRVDWPTRESNTSWNTWVGDGGSNSPSYGGIARVVGVNSSFDSINYSTENGGKVAFQTFSVIRPSAPGFGPDAGGDFATGIMNGRTVYDRLYEITDPTPDTTDIDRRMGYWDRWAGQGNPAYEDAANYLVAELESFGLEVVKHRFEFTDIFSKQNPEALNVCGYRWGKEVPNEWLVFGAHFDVAPPANSATPLLDPHITGSRTYGTRVGAYDNTAGTSMVLETAKMMSNFDSRRSMVFCFWSGEEGGKRGSDYWTDFYVKEDHPEVTVTNYINLDMAGVNWPGGGGAPHGDPEPTPDEDGYPKDEEVWPMRVYLGPTDSYENLSQKELVGLQEWIGSDALGVEQQIGTLNGEGFEEDTWKYNSWIASDRPEIIIYEDTTARSDHASFQDNLGTVTIGFGGLVDGYWCYHQVCDTLEEMEAWMDTTGKDYGEDNTGVTNLVNSLDFITWWAVYSFFHLDEAPIENTLL